MTYNIPEALAPYLEHIPEDMLVDIITEALEERIFRKNTVQPSAPLQQVDMSQLLEQLQSMLGSSAQPQLSKEVKEQVKKQDKTPIVVRSVPTEEVDDDLMGLVEDFASGIFK